jgi:hypothetical protein
MANQKKQSTEAAVREDPCPRTRVSGQVAGLAGGRNLGWGRLCVLVER